MENFRQGIEKALDRVLEPDSNPDPYSDFRLDPVPGPLKTNTDPEVFNRVFFDEKFKTLVVIILKLWLRFPVLHFTSRR